jgi:hypothetical protein
MKATVRNVVGGGLVVVGLLAAGACGGDDDSTATGGTDRGGAASGETTTTGADTAGNPTEPVIDPGDGGHYDPGIDPADFVDTIDNPYLPFAPGMRWTYEGTSDGETEVTEVVVQDERREVMGISATVVRDTVSVDGEVIEDTYDWYAQDADGNVWYLGEDTKEYEGGEVTSTEGSWEAGVDGALPGIVMQAHPEVGQAYRQEYYPGQAEDLAEVTEVGAAKSIALGDYTDVVVTREWNPLEPDVIEDKYFAPGVGLIAEQGIQGSDEVIELQRFSG